MALLKLKCPECDAGLKSATGFTAGQTVCCPKCETYFAVEEPADDEDDEPLTKPVQGKDSPTVRKAAKAVVADDDEDRSYKKSPIRFVILGVLLLVMIGLGVMLYLKKRNEAAEEKRKDDAAAAEKAREEKPPPPLVPKKEPKKKPPSAPGGTPGKGVDVGGFVTDALGDLLSGGPAAPELVPGLTRKYTAALVGAWAADLGNGVTEEITYKADGTFTARRAGPSPATNSGRYAVTTLVGTKGLRLQLDSTTGAATRAVTAIFEGDELHHPSLQPGVTAVYRKK